jgi:hypothetical protein
MTTIIQNTWIEDDDKDLLDYIKNNNIKAEYLSEEEILKLNPATIDVLFANTSVIQKLIDKSHIPPCYPDEFKELYFREIAIIKAKDVYKLNKKCFVKPYDNNKCFESHIIKSAHGVNFLLNDLKEHNISEDDNLYCCQYVNFVNEHRLFIENGKLCGMVDSTEFLIHSEKAKSITPPQEFI